MSSYANLFPPKMSSDFDTQDGGFCPQCNQAVEQMTLSTSGIDILKCVGCKGIWVKTPDLLPLSKWYCKASSIQRLPLYDQELDAWNADTDANITPSILGMIEDDNPTRNFPWATTFIIIINILMFVGFLIFPKNAETQMLVPSLLLKEPLSHFSQIFSSMFIHADIVHLLGNMYFLWVFGDNIEDRIGVFKYILLFLLCGIIADYTHALMTSDPEIPTLGASGAISGILGSYMVLYPKARINLFTIVYFRLLRFSFPAWFYLGIWFLGQQFLNIALGVQGVAWYAHIGGFIIGAVVILLMRIARLL